MACALPYALSKPVRCTVVSAPVASVRSAASVSNVSSAASASAASAALSASSNAVFVASSHSRGCPAFAFAAAMALSRSSRDTRTVFATAASMRAVAAASASSPALSDAVREPSSSSKVLNAARLSCVYLASESRSSAVLTAVRYASCCMVVSLASSDINVSAAFWRAMSLSATSSLAAILRAALYALVAAVAQSRSDTPTCVS